MLIEIRSTEGTLSGMTKVSRYPSPQRAGGRYLPYPDIEHFPKCKISTSDKILTIGSCFARNTVGLHLMRLVLDENPKHPYAQKFYEQYSKA